ncbi:MAG: hypothetical protein WB755_04455 [Terriglobales bacterium]
MKTRDLWSAVFVILIAVVSSAQDYPILSTDRSEYIRGADIVTM